MRIYLICPVRGIADQSEAAAYVAELEANGHRVHFPPRDVDQNDTTGARICYEHREAMLDADAVHVIWDVDSKGSHFDLGMAYAMGLPIVGVRCVKPDGEGKSYWKAVIALSEPTPASIEDDPKTLVWGYTP
jgi:hypothetical protein